LMSFRQKMFELSRRLLTEERGQATVPCGPETTLRSRQYISPQVTFVTITKLTAAAEGDTPLIAPVPFKWIMVVSTRQADISDTLYLHFVPLNKVYPGLAINQVGNEAWLPLCDSTGNHSKIGMGYNFGRVLPPTTMYLDIGQEAGGAAGVQITFALSDEMEYWNLVNQA